MTQICSFRTILVLFVLVVIIIQYVFAVAIPVTTIKVPHLSYKEYTSLKNTMLKSDMQEVDSMKKGLCGTIKQKQINKYFEAHPSAERNQLQCSNIITICDNPTTRNQYNNFSTSLTFELEFFIENNGNTLPTNRVAVLLSEVNQFYQPVGIQFTSIIHLWGPLQDSNGNTVDTWYTNDICDRTQSQPCYPIIPLMNLILRSLPENSRQFWPKDKTIQVFVAEIQKDDSGLQVLGFGYLPFDKKSGIVVLIPDTIRAGDRTLPHELGHVLGLFHTHTGINEISSCNDPCYERVASDVTGDLCQDTPPYPNVVEIASQFEPPTCRAPTIQEIPDSCSPNRASWSEIGSVNIMSYSSDVCATQFTTCQRQRMRCVAEAILYPRNSSTVDGGGTITIEPNSSFHVEISIFVLLFTLVFML